MKLNRIEGRKPLYQEVQEELLRLISSWDQGRPIPSESALSEQLGVSRSTVREALQRLENADLVYKRHGVGTFVRGQSSSIATAMNYLHGVEPIIEASGKSPSLSVHEVSPVPLDPSTQGVFGDPVPVNALRVTRVYLADAVPTLYAVSYIPDRVLPPELDAAARRVYELGQSGESLYSILSSEYGHDVDYAVTRIRAVMPSAEVTRYMGLSSSEPCVELNQIHHDREGRVIIYSQDILDADVFELIVLRKSIR